MQPPNFFREIKSSQFTPDDVLYGDQWNLPNIGMPNAWTTSRGNGIRIAIMDVATNLNHPDLAPNIVPGFDPTGQPIGFDTHGTQVAGVAGARGNNTIGIAGVAFEASIIPVRMGFTPFPNSNILGTTDAWVIECFNRCRDQNQLNADIINCSFSLGSPSSAVTNAINSAVSNGRNGRGCVVCAATGNNNLNSVSYPANLPSVIGVGATDQNGHRAPFSNWGNGINISAPGMNILTTNPPNGYIFENGTSLASPAVAGVAALLLTIIPNASPSTILSRMTSSAARTGGYNYQNGWSPQLGAGRVNAASVISSALSYFRIQGQSYLCSGQQTYFIPDANNVTWSAGTGITISPNTGVATSQVSNDGFISTIFASINTGFLTINESRNIIIGAYHNEFFANGYASSGWFSWASMYMPLFFSYNVSDLSNRIQFGYAPMIGRTTGNPWQTGQPIWPVGGVSGIQIISQPQGWTNVQILGDEIRFSNGDPEGLLEVRLFTSCGSTTVILSIRRQ
ncbi:S8 family peptidase [Anditalea andensis]|uniref:Peptidase S8/S53 domain-containing protein n=1 Tax=Anditalea andensis TaxID=1048983 RepID=A0A074LPR5_9BACT|nr:S8 family serine peptidase [Anditalea andensis]KEO75937.1 hypothetical protein EL17_00035 [Anditalea andensis]